MKRRILTATAMTAIAGLGATVDAAQAKPIVTVKQPKAIMAQAGYPPGANWCAYIYPATQFQVASSTRAVKVFDPALTPEWPSYTTTFQHLEKGVYYPIGYRVFYGNYGTLGVEHVYWYPRGRPDPYFREDAENNRKWVIAGQKNNIRAIVCTYA